MTHYVANQFSNTVSVIDGATNAVTATVNVGSEPGGVRADPKMNLIYVANYGANTVSVIDGATNTVLTTLIVGTGPNGVGVDSTTDRIYIANTGAYLTVGNVSVIKG